MAAIRSVLLGISPEPGYDDGVTPSCAINVNNVAVEAHSSKDGAGDLYYGIATVANNALHWVTTGTNYSDQNGSSSVPSVAMTRTGTARFCRKLRSQAGPSHR